MSAGIEYACALNLTGDVGCWGRNDSGQLDPPTGTYSTVSAGFEHACGLRTDGKPACWGNSHLGKTSPPDGTFTAVSAGAEHTCGIRTSGWIACWGSNEYGQSVPPLGLRPVVSAGWYHSCALRPDDTITCWGDGADGATIVPAGTYKTVSAGQGFTCAIRTAETLACWGYNGSGQTAAPSGTYIAVSAGGNHACAIRADGTVACWGANTYGQASPPSGTYMAVSAGYRNTCALQAVSGWISCWGSDEDGVVSADPAYYHAVSVGAFHACALKYDNSIGCWGYPGDGRTNPPAGTFTEVGAGFYHGCGLRTNATLACWGYDGDRQASPPAGTYITVSTGAWHSCGLATSGNVVCWGWNYYNQATTSEPAPTTYVPVAPTRLLDSRSGNGLSGKFKANTARTFQVAGRGLVPANAVAVTGNFTVTGQTSGGYASVTPVATNTPTTSSLNFPFGDNRANNVTVVLGPGGKLGAVYKAGAGQTTDFVFDVTGYFLADETGATYTPATRSDCSIRASANGLNGTFKAGTPRTWQITGRGEIPAGATAITANLTVVGQTRAGFVTLGPTATATSVDVHDQLPAGRYPRERAHREARGQRHAVRGLHAGAGAATHLVLDVTGYYMADLNGTRFYLSRPIGPRLALRDRSRGTFKANTARTLTVAARVGVPAEAVAVTGNLTVTGPTQLGYMSMTQTTTNTPSTSTLNFPRSDTRANGVTGPLRGSGTVGLVERAGTGATTHLILDITGYFASPSTGASASPLIQSANPARGSSPMGDERNGMWRHSPDVWQH